MDFKIAYLCKTNKNYFKYKVIITDLDNTGFVKKIYFGDRRYQDYTQHKNQKRKALYLLRHKKREKWTDYTTKSFWATNILWNKDTIKKSIMDICRRYGIVIIRK